MEVLFVLLIAAILTGCLVYVNNILSGLVQTTLHAEQYMATMLGSIRQKYANIHSSCWAVLY